MRVIDITNILSQDLKYRSRTNDLMLYVKNSKEERIILDFSNVKFATRSLMDEFYNLFVKNADSLRVKMELTNVPEDVASMICSGSRTQNRVKTIAPTSKVVVFKDTKQMLDYLNSIAF